MPIERDWIDIAGLLSPLIGSASAFGFLLLVNKIAEKRQQKKDQITSKKEENNHKSRIYKSGISIYFSTDEKIKAAKSEKDLNYLLRYLNTYCKDFDEDTKIFVKELNDIKALWEFDVSSDLERYYEEFSAKLKEHLYEKLEKYKPKY